MRTDWFIKAKYGLFVHFGLYSLLGGLWKGERAPHTAEWIMRNMQIPLAEYRPLAEKFNPVQLNPREIVRRAKAWGMRYVTVTAKHHDGFALYDSQVSSYTVMHTPYGKDIVREFAEACQAEGVIFCVYYSQMQDWEHPHGNGNTWDFQPEKQDFRKYFYEKCIPQVQELLSNYGPIGMIWFDTPYDMPQPLCQELREAVLACQPNCLINGRIGYGLGDYRQMADNAIPHNAYFQPWEVPMTLNGTWGYSSVDHRWETAAGVIERLSRIASKGGNLLLNIGPDGEGRIPPLSLEILDEVGEWLAKNEESIRGTQAIADFPYDIRWGCITYSAEKNRLYFHVKSYPAPNPRLFLIGLESKVSKVYLLADGKELAFSQTYEQARDERRLYIHVPPECPDARDTVVVLELAEPLRIQTL